MLTDWQTGGGANSTFQIEMACLNLAFLLSRTLLPLETLWHFQDLGALSDSEIVALR